VILELTRIVVGLVRMDKLGQVKRLVVVIGRQNRLFAVLEEVV